MKNKKIKNFFYRSDDSFTYYLLKGNKNILIDTGVLERYKILENFLDNNLSAGEKIDIILLTHSHYDHCGCVPFLKENFPEVKIFASERTKYIFSNKEARIFIKNMNEKNANDLKYNYYETLNIDKTLKENDIIKNSNFKIKTFETPGHTKCSISFYIKNYGLLFPGDTLGVIEKNGAIKPLFFSSYIAYIKSIKKIINLSPEILAPPHNNIISSGKNVKYFLDKIYKKTLSLGEKLDEMISAGKDENKILNEYFLKKYSKKDAITQPTETFLLNFRSLVRAYKKDKRKGNI